MKTKVMGILNVTPDSFYDGGKYMSMDSALRRVDEMISQGADIIDIGGESSRPGSSPISIEEEKKRIMPIIENISKEFTVPISVDTYKPEVAIAAFNSGATILNDIFALRYHEDMVKIAKKFKKIILMHMQATPKTMQINPSYKNVVREIFQFFRERIKFCQSNGINKDKIIIDPGIGFGKSTKHNLQLLKFGPDEFKKLNTPIMFGISRKSFIGRILGSEDNPLPPQERLEGGIALSTWLIIKGVDILRTHDVKETVQTIKLLQALSNVNN